MERKKIVFIIPSLTSGGAERVVSILANMLLEFYDVKIILLYKNKPFYFLDKGISIKFCKRTYSRKSNFFKSIINHVYMIKQVFRFTKGQDIIIGFTTTCNVYAIIASKLIKIPSIISERINPNYSVENKFWNTIRKKIYPKSDMVILQTGSVKDFYKRFINENKLTVIPNPIDPELQNRINVNQIKENIILTVGRFTKQKNHEILINAFANIPHNNWKLLIIGDGEEKQAYKKLIRDLNKEEYIFLVERTTDIHTEYNRAKIFALTSDYEGFPNVLIEAMSFGIPSISSDCPTGPSDIIEHNKNGLLFPVNDQKALETQLIELMNNEELRIILSKNAVNSVSRLNADNIVSQWRTIINKLL
ncbi:glycosyltransferase family 4 protein [Yeosuana sp. MJ-SS3]|uniref:Glycosyltransferase family 4 protein n=1 Tax=Gilvirhabdus luticola TaxID=3079858 RepID=A0ABU3U6W3_9FLAO|nr:glycosyltransferase family 4 protein [Yeosuana sp. MJ-SS3]MDU8886141.1 glycosyltransferase family 4 protein [Yeosuana sp. MJ-SS3]